MIASSQLIASLVKMRKPLEYGMYTLITAVNFGVGGASFFNYMYNEEHPFIPMDIVMEW